MLDNLAEEHAASQFMRQLDRALGITSSSISDHVDEEIQGDLDFAARLLAVSCGEESRVQEQLRARLAKQTRHPALRMSGRWSPIQLRPGLAVLLFLIGVLVFFATGTPALAAIQRFFGYGYLPEAGFIRLSETTLLKGPVTQQHDGQAVTLWQGMIQRGEVSLWVRAGFDLAGIEQATLVLSDGARRSPTHLQKDGQVVALTFTSLPPSALPERLVWDQWMLPLSWLPADQAGLAPTQVTIPHASRTPVKNAEERPCADIGPGDKLCVQAAFTGETGTSLLLQRWKDGNPAPLKWDSSGPLRGAALSAPGGHTYALLHVSESSNEDPSTLLLRFENVPAGVRVVDLRLPNDFIPGLPSIDLALGLPEIAPNRSPTPQVIQQAPIPVQTPGKAQTP